MTQIIHPTKRRCQTWELKNLRYFGSIHYLYLSFSIYSIYKILESNIVSRSLVLHKILHKHTGNGSYIKNK